MAAESTVEDFVPGEDPQFLWEICLDRVRRAMQKSLYEAQPMAGKAGSGAVPPRGHHLSPLESEHEEKAHVHPLRLKRSARRETPRRANLNFAPCVGKVKLFPDACPGSDLGALRSDRIRPATEFDQYAAVRRFDPRVVEQHPAPISGGVFPSR